MEERILEIIENNKDYKDALENVEVFNILINGMLDSCKTDDEIIEGMVNTIFSCSVVFENVMKIISQYADKRTIDNVADMISEIFEYEDAEDREEYEENEE